MCLKSIYTHVAHTLLYGEYFVWCTPSPVQQKQTKLFVCTARNVHSLLLLFQSDKRYKMYYYCTVLFKKSVSTRAHYGGGFSAPTLTELQAHLKHHLTKRAEILSLFILTPTIFRFGSGSEVGRRRGSVLLALDLHINVYGKA